jgi:hypothetical protein
VSELQYLPDTLQHHYRCLPRTNCRLLPFGRWWVAEKLVQSLVITNILFPMCVHVRVCVRVWRVVASSYAYEDRRARARVCVFAVCCVCACACRVCVCLSKLHYRLSAPPAVGLGKNSGNSGWTSLGFPWSEHHSEIHVLSKSRFNPDGLILFPALCNRCSI